MAFTELRRHLKHLAGLPVRGYEVGNLLDVFILCAVATILVVRIFLWMTGYPQIGGRHLHIAHMLWGGLLMMAALILMQSIIMPWARRLGAVLGGIGFGLFIDELGKFITRDNNYFFQPTFAIIYIFFILFYLGTRTLLRRRGLNPHESLVNAIEFLKEAAVGDLSESEKQKALSLLRKADPKNPITAPLQSFFEGLTPGHPGKPFVWDRIAKGARKIYLKWAASPSFPKVIAAFFLAAALVDLFDIPKHIFHMVKAEDLNFSEWAVVVSGTVSTVLVIIGDVQLLRRNTLVAYRWFDRALLVAILVGQVFIFVHVQLKGIVNLVMLLFLLISVRYMIAQEERILRMKGGDVLLLQKELSLRGGRSQKKV